jgi:hypothetical protein
VNYVNLVSEIALFLNRHGEGPFGWLAKPAAQDELRDAAIQSFKRCRQPLWIASPGARPGSL